MIDQSIDQSIKLSEDVGLSEEKEIFVVNADLYATVLGQQNLVPSNKGWRMKIASNVSLSGSDSNNFTLVRILRLVSRKVDSASCLHLFGGPSYQYSVRQRRE